MSHLPIPSKGKFYDLNIPYEDNKKHIDTLTKLSQELGYSVIAFSRYIASGSLKKGSKLKKLSDPCLEAVKTHNTSSCTVLSRVTIELKEIDDQITVRDITTLGRYDLVAVQPKTEKLFLAACTSLNIDIITLQGTEKLPFFKTHQVRAAIARGLHFEICYSPMLRDPSIRRITTTNGIKLNECCKGRNIILSSNAIQPSELRGPHDVANLALLFGLKENEVPHTVSSNCRGAVVHGFTQKTAKGAVFIQKIDSSQNVKKRRLMEDEENQAKIQKIVDN